MRKLVITVTKTKYDDESNTIRTKYTRECTTRRCANKSFVFSLHRRQRRTYMYVTRQSAHLLQSRVALRALTCSGAISICVNKLRRNTITVVCRWINEKYIAVVETS